MRTALPAHGACSAEAARALYADGHAFLDVRSSLELETEGKLLPQLPGVFHAPLVDLSKRFDAASGRKLVAKAPSAVFLAAVARQLPDKARGVLVVCSGVPSQGVLRAAAAADALRAAGYTRVVVLTRGYAVRRVSAAVAAALALTAATAASRLLCAQDWSLRFTNKLERRVLGFLIASGGTSIEQRGGVSSAGSGVAGKSLDALLRDAQAPYIGSGIYADVA